MLQTGEGGMTPRVIKRVKENIMDGINILDSPPGTSCPVVETVKNSDITPARNRPYSIRHQRFKAFG